jgi:regulator of sirC expression with transglutaminase-like and TPR domain
MTHSIRRLCAVALFASLVTAARSDETEKQPAEKPKPPAAAPSVEKLVTSAQPSVVVVTFTGRDGKQQGVGTGFVISPDGMIATNYHVIGEARPIKVQLADGSEHKVTEIHASDRKLDLALIKIEAKDLPVLKLGDSDKLKQGQAVVALGNPVGLKHSVVSGVVSGTREIDGRSMIQLAIPLEGGNSGGPLIDMEGRVHGILTMKSLVTANLGFAVAINHLKPLIEKPNPIQMSQWLTIGALDPKEWKPLLGADWQQRAGHILAQGRGSGFGGRSLCLRQQELPKLPFEIAVQVKLDDEAGAAGLVFHSDGGDRHYGFYPSAGKLRLSRFEGPNVFTWKVLQEVESDHYKPGKWNFLKVRIEKDRIRCFVNDQPVIDSQDRGFVKGSVGLAKFRQTQAEFKRFQIAQKIAVVTPSPEVIKRVNELIDKLPAGPDFVDSELEQLSNDADVSTSALQRRAAELQQRADELRRLANDVHTQSVIAKLVEVLKEKEEGIDLARAALLIAVLDDAEVDVDGYLSEIERMAAAVTANLTAKLPKDTEESQWLAALDEYLFKQNGFHGSRTDYYHRANSYLNRVIDDREGLPITLSLLYMEIGRRLGLKIEGVGLPGHFVVRFVPKKGESQLIDVFDGGTKLSREDAAKKLNELGRGPLLDEHLEPYTKKAVVVRMLHNLLGIAQRADEPQQVLRYLDALLAIDESLLQERVLRAMLRKRTGRDRAALADLDWFLENEPEGIDLDRVRQMRAQFE